MKIFQKHCRNNKIIRIENLPIGLTKFEYTGNEIRWVDGVDIRWFPNGKFNLSFYNLIKKFQLAFKRKFKKQQGLFQYYPCPKSLQNRYRFKPKPKRIIPKNTLIEDLPKDLKHFVCYT